MKINIAHHNDISVLDVKITIVVNIEHHYFDLSCVIRVDIGITPLVLVRMKFHVTFI